MPVPIADHWIEQLRQALERYDEPLLRQVAARLIRPRSQWPVEELIERCVAAAENPPVIDRRLKELAATSRSLLAAIGQSQQPRWPLGSLVELAIALGESDGLQPVFDLFEAGLLYPCSSGRLKSFELWLGQASGSGLWAFVPPHVATRAADESIELADTPAPVQAIGHPVESDGLEWPLRLAVVWQQVAGAPLRRTQQGDFFKRDLERLEQDPLLNAPPSEALAGLPNPARLAVALAEVEGVLREGEGELRAAELSPTWDDGLLPTLQSLWAALPLVQSWDALDGWRSPDAVGNPFPSAYLLALLLLARLPEDGWLRPGDIETWIQKHHPYWQNEDLRPSRLQSWAPAFLLGLAHQLRFVQAAKDAEGEWVVRLSPLGRALIGLAEPPTLDTPFKQTLLVQPNLEIVAYRQGLTPALIARLAKFAQLKSLGAACILQLGPECVYRALESDLTFEAILQCLEQHGTRATPPTVIESLRTWADKRDRLTIYPAAALLEFNSAEELNEALARGVPAMRLSDRLALIADESGIDYRHFRLIGTRDYGLPPEKCVEVAADGVTLSIDLARSDLLLETELPRFAERLEKPGLNGRREYRLTPTSLAAAKASGMGLVTLEAWFQQRSGHPLSAAARLLFVGAELPAPELRRHLVLHVPTPDLADGLMQWPETRALIEARMGPTALAVAEEKASELQRRLQGLGMELRNGDSHT
jgi:hypothetical protein